MLEHLNKAIAPTTRLGHHTEHLSLQKPLRDTRVFLLALMAGREA